MYKRKYAPELRKEYEVYANFYETEIEGIGRIKCRNVADIVRIGNSTKTKIDCYCVMMNPGSCKPADKSIEIESKPSDEIEFIKAYDDPAHRQLMNLMRLQKWNHVRIINLSDMMTGKSEKHAELIAKAKDKKYSIFCDHRKNELNKLIKKKAPFIIAWGYRKELHEEAVIALNRLKNKTIIGIPFENSDCYYRYIKPQNWDECDKIIMKLNRMCNEKGVGDE